uniref:Phosphoglucan, water dikinase n=2 Tax=Tetraselmis sp. GSL018 TaxID=582737 RepID=A0A061RNS8_9CHLO|mmetsp:Transcript_17622/g.42267  ORF Transcript_17622/g.42267 Transcript_17622/m.42267 type:complete len:1258 (+) Transcript_17622:106-3879(+)|eukprot:CAMPEP_0177611952 /NCGR_PEP_ID=MMETSP0419_2-20121207/20879_1 /TAXON_ID=582737 /ORGANISM="Tetraselmis sp., Strain GSL018" /LENGTH=1257 /DNA_ID=CAMNT_0019107943 /DNA_START=62 /DNA_END=3835 /DNA_ORIENTATION=-
MLNQVFVNSNPSALRRYLPNVPSASIYGFRLPRKAKVSTVDGTRVRQYCMLKAFLLDIRGAVSPRKTHVTSAKQMFAAKNFRGTKVLASAVNVQFQMPNEVEFGEGHKIVGSCRQLGDWSPDNAAEMQWSEGHVWTAEVALEPGQEVEFKCVKAGGGGVSWEEGNNRRLRVPEGASSLTVRMAWNETDDTEASADGASETAAGGNGPAPEQPVEADGAERPPEQQGDADPERAPAESSLGSMDSDRPEHEQWAGAQVQFMTENRHSRERSGKWDTAGLEGAALALVQGDRKAASWLQKLKVVEELLVESAERKRPELDALVNASAYLLWINTGAIQCVEGGGHYRPNRHAELSRNVFRSLEWVLEDRERTLAEKLVARRIHPRLPSFSAEFTASVPLTRIRDIAHRNDIPHDLKREIKHTLQNKLHRNAGPEDLIATEQMLRRVTANPGEYSEAFVAEFKTFYEELKDFFNAGSLKDLLDNIEPSLDGGSKTVVQTFLTAKGKVDGSQGAPEPQDLMEALHCLTSLRAMLVAGLSSGLRNDASDEALAMRQAWRLCEIRAEEYAFVLLSYMENHLTASGGHEELAGSRDRSWALPIGATVLGLRHLGLSGWNPAECVALEAELEAWQRQGFFAERIQALRLKATLERCLRTTEDYANLLLKVYPERVRKLGNALGVEERLQNVYTEAEIRAGVVFQLSKLATLLSKAARAASGSPPWDVVVSGRAAGKLLRMDSFDPGEAQDLARNEDVVLLVGRATGDEEVAGSRGLKGIILEQEIAHLSHLGVRARQEGIVFVTSEDREAIDALKPLVGKAVALDAGSGSVKVEEKTDSGVDRAQIVDALKRGTEQTDTVPKRRDEVVKVLAKGVEIIKSEGGGSDNGVLTFSFVEDAASEVMEDEELMSILSGASGSAAGKGAEPGTGESNRGRPPAGAFSRAQAQEVLALADATTERCGAKAASCAQLARAAAASSGAWKAPGGAVVPFGVMELALEEAGKKARFEELLAAVETAEVGDVLDSACEELQELVSSVRPSEAVAAAAADLLPGGGATISRSSSNVEDLAGMSGAGLYDSVPSKGPSDPEDLLGSISQVWASLYTRRAVLARRAAGVAQADASMAVLVMPLLEPESSFVLHTTRPVDRNPGFLYAEIAPGQGELLASGSRGTPWRLYVDKATGDTETVAFANFSQAMRADGGRLVQRAVDYSSEALSRSDDFRAELGRRLMEVGVALEREFGAPQDIEGALVGGEVYVVQSRPQPL